MKKLLADLLLLFAIIVFIVLLKVNVGFENLIIGYLIVYIWEKIRQ